MLLLLTDVVAQAEEEKYTNKVIEVFNAGLLKLPEQDRGITLRAYLADQLGCDPMRITKKFTGAACLGKRVYHFDYLNANQEEAEKARSELVVLETAFRAKLEQLSKRRQSDSSAHVEHHRIVSTPAIDALMQRSHPMGYQPVRLEDVKPYPAYQHHSYYYPPMLAHPHQPLHMYELPRPGIYAMPPKESDKTGASSSSSSDPSSSRAAYEYPPGMFRRDDGAPSAYYPQAYPHPMMAQYYMPPPPMYGHYESLPPHPHLPSIRSAYPMLHGPPIPYGIEPLVLAAEMAKPSSLGLPASAQASSGQQIGAVGEGSSAETTPAFLLSAASMQAAGAKKRPLSAAEEEALNKRTKVSEKDQNAASHLLGFMNHLQVQVQSSPSNPTTDPSTSTSASSNVGQA